ncbi:MAG: response regulator transcription factor [Selenomonas sp.]|uniref:response regulator transcription factor n=1 Tax=Selenomonas sp. TaxID=2053611 RepID=UPI0025DDFE58|nr:response regulator transcription factor [Selenomonas sp.]MCI6099936.1 response regulator transcription factor [Selenomonas sp.]MCI6232779.1 response regulator transcription factor [Selenomonas sp.]
MEPAKILVVDDDADIREIISIYLRNAGYEPVEAEDGAEALAIVEAVPDIALVILDLMMPRMDGSRFCIELRKKSVIPVIMLSARAEDMDKVNGLSLGADDYLTKPFNPIELVARVKSQLRRYLQYQPAAESAQAGSSQHLELRDLVLDLATHTVTVRGKEVHLTPKEFSILELLLAHPGQVFRPESIYEAVWDEPFMESDATVMVHIRNIREKIERQPRKPEYLRNVWGVGYKIE